MVVLHETIGAQLAKKAGEIIRTIRRGVSLPISSSRMSIAIIVR